MEILTLLLTNLLAFFAFVRENIIKIIIGTITIILFYFATWLTMASLKKLKIDVFSYYPFDRFFPKSTKWSALYFLTLVLFLGLLIFFFLRGFAYSTPA